MKRIPAIMLTAMTVLLSLAVAVTAQDSTEIRGQVATGDFTWTPENFAGFYYDIDDNIGTESLTTAITDDRTLSGDQPYGVIYETTAQPIDFEFEPWGQYNVIGFMAEKYFAGYIDMDNTSDDILAEESDDENVLADEQLLKILVDDDTERTISSGNPLKLEDGYELQIRSIDVDGNKVYLELTKDGDVVDSQVISPSATDRTMADETYIYDEDVGDSKDVVLIAVHFKNAFRGAENDLATVDGEWQLSKEITDVSENQEFAEMQIETVTDTTITMANEDNDISLNKGDDRVDVFEDVFFKVADADELRYYPYKEVTEAGTYEVRGAVATESFKWNAENFAGFYYDIDDNIGTETLTTEISDERTLSGDQPYGVTYETCAQPIDFEFEPWGQYNVIGFMAEKYFAGYVDAEGTNDILFEESDDENVLADEQLLKILVDDDTERTISSGNPLKLEDGYELQIRSIDVDGNKVYLELTKDGDVVDSQVISPSATDRTMADETYIYKEDVGDSKDVVLVAVHFKNAFRGAENDLATVDGEWQLSNTVTDVSENQEFGEMQIETVTDTCITMANEDNDISLNKGDEKVEVFEDVFFKVADADELRYYPYKEVTIGGETPAAETAAEQPAAPAVEEAPVEEAPVVAPETNVTKEENVTTPAEAGAQAGAEAGAQAGAEAGKEAGAEAGKEAGNEAEKPAGGLPGFEAVISITGLVAVAYLVLGRKQ